jgi:hypothetical protein
VDRPGGNPPTSVFAASPDEAWAVGQKLVDINLQTLTPVSVSTMHHYSAGQWQLVTDPDPPGAGLHRVYMVSPTEGWAVGNHGTILHYQDGQWSAYGR